MTGVPVSEFEGWLAKGLGRAVVYLKTHASAPYREAVLHACTHKLAYDSQGDYEREEYLWDLTHACGDVAFIRSGLSYALNEAFDSDEIYLSQVLELLCEFAKSGDETARREMYEALTFGDAGLWYEPLIRLDGISALIRASEYLPPTIDGDDDWMVANLVDALRERDGVEQANDAIYEAALADAKVQRLLDLVREHEEWGRDATPRPRPSYSELKVLIAEKGSSAPVVSWGRTASKEELQLAANDLLVETDEDRLIAYLNIFRFDDCPGPIDRHLELAEHPNERIQFIAVRILSRKVDAAVRRLALRLLDLPGRVDEAIQLLVSNYEPGDFRMIEERLRSLTNPDVIHSVGISLNRVFKTHLAPDSADVLLLMYEIGPCCLCRDTYVECLLKLDKLPDRIREECQFDASPDIRKMVQKQALG